MSYSPDLSTSIVGMSLLTGAKSTANASPTAASATPNWIDLPATAADGVSFSCPVLFRGVAAALGQTRARLGDSNDANNYKEQSALCVYRSGTTDDLLEEVSDDEMIFYRGVSSEILPSIRLQYTSGTNYPGLSFDSSETRYIAFRLGL